MANTTTTPPTETIADDDLCPICHLLIVSPVQTTCSHTLCASCMEQWAATCTTTTTLPLPSPSATDLSDFFSLNVETENLHASCPMCRTPTTATPSALLSSTLEQKYPITYASRRAEDELSRGLRTTPTAPTIPTGQQASTLLIGNQHHIQSDRADGNQHDWTFFIHVSEPALVEQILVHLHPTFRPRRVSLPRPPFEVRRLGWGTFRIFATVVLRGPFEWVGGEGNGPSRRELELDWMLDFEGRGSLARIHQRVERQGVAPRTSSAVALGVEAG